MPSSSPWRRSTSWQPGMQPAKSCATSKNALLQSVTRESSASRSASTRPLRWRVDALELLDRGPGPHAPVAEQPALDAHAHLFGAALHGEGHQQVEHDVVVVAGVQRDAVLGARRDHAAHDVERAVAVEGRDLDRDHVVDGGEAAPEFHRQRDAADRGLQVEAHQRNLARPRRRNAPPARRPTRPSSPRATACRRDSRAPARCRASASPAPCGPTGPAIITSGRCAQSRAVSAASFEHRLVQAALADGELGGVHAHRQAARAGVQVVARERALAPWIELRAARPAPAGAPGSPCRGAAARASLAAARPVQGHAGNL